MAKKITAYQCKYCTSFFRLKKETLRHEDDCNFGPKEKCWNCEFFILGSRTCNQNKNTDDREKCELWQRSENYLSNSQIAARTRKLPKPGTRRNIAIIFDMLGAGKTREEIIAENFTAELVDICIKSRNSI